MPAAPQQTSATVDYRPDYVSARKAAVLLGLHRQTVVAMIERGELVANYYAGRWNVPLAELRRLSADTRAKPQEDA